MNFFKNVFKNPKEKDSKSPTSPTGQMPRSPRELAQAAPTTPLAQKQSSKESEYVMGKTLGQGTYGVVRLCTHAPTNRKLACKVIQKKFLKKNKAEHMIQKEVAALRLVDHDNCISLVDFFETPATYCMVFELATGGELFDRIVEKGSFNERDAAVIVATITNAIAFLHDVGIVHRDLKPENLLFKNKDDNSPLTIVDFGISKVVDGPNLLTTVCGTPGYTAPEILQKVPYGKKVDIFSLGVVSYVLLCGYLPFGDSADIASLCDRVVKGDYEFDSPYWDHISQLGKDFVRDALLTDPDQRPDAHKLMKHPWLVKYTPPGYLQYLRDLNVEAHRRNNPNWIATPEYSDEIPETEAVTRRKTVQQSRKLHMTRKGQTTKKKSTVKGDESNLGVPSTAPAEGPKVEEEPAPRLSFEQNDEDDEALFAAAELLPDDHEDVANPFAMDRVSIRKVGLLGLSQQADLELLPIEADIRVLPNLLSERNQSVPREKVVNVAKTVGRTQATRKKDSGASLDAASTPPVAVSVPKVAPLTIPATEVTAGQLRRSFDSDNSIGHSPTSGSPPQHLLPLEDEDDDAKSSGLVLPSVVRALTRGRAGTARVPEDSYTSSSAGSEDSTAFVEDVEATTLQNKVEVQA